jgi:hypothetical protein
MPTTGPPRSIADRPTRQQLDELDALMQRMLALPVDSDDRSVTTANAFSSASAQPENPDAVPPAPPSSSSGVAMDLLTQRRTTVEQSIPRVASDTANQPVHPDESKLPAVPVSEHICVSWWLLPVWWVNRAFDGAIGWLGPPGRWLRGHQGRTFLALVGLFLLAAALAWLLVDGIDWTW